MKIGDSIVVIKGSQRGRVGIITEINGKCAGEPAVFVCLKGKRCSTYTFYPQSYVVVTK